MSGLLFLIISFVCFDVVMFGPLLDHCAVRYSSEKYYGNKM
jgi:hypothetical protein